MDKECAYIDIDYYSLGELEFETYKCNIFFNENDCDRCQKVSQSKYYNPCSKFYNTEVIH